MVKSNKLWKKLSEDEMSYENMIATATIPFPFIQFYELPLSFFSVVKLFCRFTWNSRVIVKYPCTVVTTPVS